MEPRVSTPFSSGVYQVPWERVATPLATRSVILAGIFTCPGHCIQEPYHRHGCYGRRHLPGGSRVFVGPVCEAPGYCHGPYGCGICCASRITATESALSAGPPDLPAGLRTGDWRHKVFHRSFPQFSRKQLDLPTWSREWMMLRVFYLFSKEIG